MMIFVQICRALTILCCCASAFLVIDSTIRIGVSAIQQTAGYALAIAVVVIPYIFTRSVEGFPFPPDK
jgi:hypothetical protein